ncbi:MAG: cardiolipin synthase [Firmicutes bacterium]|nr:cardiolipin synthase [Bacillota bacterium]
MNFTTVIYILNVFVSIFIIFAERKRPSSTIAWIMLLFVLPGAGIVLYIMLSQLLARYRLSSLSSSMHFRNNPFLLDQKRSINEGSFHFVNTQAAAWRQLIKFNQEYASAYLTQNNEIKIFTAGQECFNSMFEDLKAAKSSINMEFFIMKPDYIGLELVRILTEKAREGVKVKLLLDAMGCRRMRRKHFDELRSAGGQVVFFFPARIFKLDLKLNYRNHRKLLIIDNTIAYIGGLNAAKEYVGDSRKFGGWRDTHLRIRGGSVFDIDSRFIMDWNFANGQEIELNVADYPVDTSLDCAVQVVSSGPESQETEIKFGYLKMINSAKRSIYIQSPYLVPDESIFEALKTAAVSGVDVRIMIPPMPDHPFVYWVTYQNLGTLVSYGAKAYIYEKGFLHSKTIVVDDEAASVGSANFDIRSFELNFECNVFAYDREIAIELRKAFEDDMKNSRRLTQEDYERRSNWIKVKESVSRLITDIL